jgi:large subunit ribosomal protein L2
LSENIKVGDKIYSGILNKNINLGYTCLLNNIRLFTIINNIEIYPGRGFSLSRSAGSSSLLTSINRNIATLKLKSGFNMFLSVYNLANFGLVSNMEHKFNNLNKAGKS